MADPSSGKETPQEVPSIEDVIAALRAKVDEVQKESNDIPDALLTATATDLHTRMTRIAGIIPESLNVAVSIEKDAERLAEYAGWRAYAEHQWGLNPDDLPPMDRFFTGGSGGHHKHNEGKQRVSGRSAQKNWRDIKRIGLKKGDTIWSDGDVSKLEIQGTPITKKILEGVTPDGQLMLKGQTEPVGPLFEFVERDGVMVHEKE